jgi:chromatin assembly factor 1 subunit A
MPSLEIIQVVDGSGAAPPPPQSSSADDDAPTATTAAATTNVPPAAPTASSSASTTTTSTSVATAQKPKKAAASKITPMETQSTKKQQQQNAKKKKQAASMSVGQMALTSFFGKKTAPSSPPRASTENSTAKKQAPAAGAASEPVAQPQQPVDPHKKSALRDICLGTRRTAVKTAKETTKVTASDAGEKETVKTAGTKQNSPLKETPTTTNDAKQTLAAVDEPETSVADREETATTTTAAAVEEVANNKASDIKNTDIFDKMDMMDVATSKESSLADGIEEQPTSTSMDTSATEDTVQVQEPELAKEDSGTDLTSIEASAAASSPKASDEPEAQATRKRSASVSSPPAASATNPAAKKRAVADKAASPTAAATASSSIPTKERSDEHQKLIDKHAAMRVQYSQRATQVLQRCQNVAEEDFEIPLPDKASLSENVDFTVFPDAAVPVLVALIEGSSRPITLLASLATSRLNAIYETENFTLEIVTNKLKLLATRKNYIKNPSIAIVSDANDGPVDLFEDEQSEYMWRWEVSLLDLLPTDSHGKVKKARAARKKLGTHFAALAKLLGSLTEADKLLALTTVNQARLDKLLARISQEEEKVLKFEREEEVARLALEAKVQKEQAKAEKEQAKSSDAQKLKEEAKKQKELEKERLAQEKEAEKLKKAQEKELAKQQKLEEKERKKLEKAEKEAKEQAKKEAEIKKQAARLKSFFQTKTSETDTKADTGAGAVKEPTDTACESTAPGDFISDAFWKAINSSDSHQSLFSSLSRRARQSCRRRTPRASLTVTVTVFPEDEAEDNPFNESEGPYAEERQITVEVLNKKKFLSFHEDVRPPYFGTWSKKSDVITGRTPFGQDSVLEYDQDSEAEWEEGDEEVGEDVEMDNDEEDDKELDDYETNDGWFANDDEVDYEGGDIEVDEEEKRFKWNRLKQEDQRVEQVVCTISPAEGLPMTDAHAKRDELVEGFSFEEACDLARSHTMIVLDDSPVYLDAFPPDMIEEGEPAAADNASCKVMSDDDMRAFARFVHRCTLGSKEKLVDDLRSKHETLTSSRSQALRVLDTIAEKKKLAIGNQCVWEVKTEVLESLSLDDLIDAGNVDPDDVLKTATRTIARFVHHSVTSSKERIVDDLRQAEEHLGLSRPQALKILDEIAEKKKHPVRGIYWEIKQDSRVLLNLHDLPSDPPVLENIEGSVSANAAPSAGSGKNSKTKPRSESSGSPTGSQTAEIPKDASGSSSKQQKRSSSELSKDKNDGESPSDDTEGTVADAAAQSVAETDEPTKSPKKQKTTDKSVMLLQAFLLKKKNMV